MISKRFSKRTIFVLLLCFVTLFGVVGAYAFMLNNQASVESSRRAVSNGYVLEIDKSVYEPGEIVRITFRNNSPKTVTFRDSGWYTIRDSEGRQVYPGLVLDAFLSVSSGKSLKDGWYPLTVTTEVRVPPGNYTVELSTPTISRIPELEDLSVSFEILD